MIPVRDLRISGQARISNGMISDGKFGKIEHILKTRDFALIYKKGRSVKKNSIILCFLPNALGYNRIGFSIGSRNIKLSTRRNRIRRLLREAFRKNKPRLKSGYDMVFIVKKDIAKPFLYKDAEALFFKLIKEAGLIP